MEILYWFRKGSATIGLSENYSIFALFWKIASREQVTSAASFSYSESKVPTGVHGWKAHYKTDWQLIINAQESESEVYSAGNPAGRSETNKNGRAP